MMLRIVLLAAVITLVKTDINSEWEAFKVKYGRQYNSSEDARRFEIFQKKVKMINAHNEKYAKGQSLFSMAVNQFSDQTAEDMGLQDRDIDKKRTEGEVISTAFFSASTSGEAPSSKNWVEEGYVTSVKDQGEAGTCYAFAAVGAIEAQYRKYQSCRVVDLSVAQVIDCAGGCQGGYAEDAFKYAKDKGMMLDKDYEYVAENYPEDKEDFPQECLYDESKVVANICDYYGISRSESAIINVVAENGPVFVGIYIGDKFQSYEDGIFDECDDGDGWHAVLVVGYGNVTTNNGIKYYWLIKNSWGADWGEKGYMRMERGTDLCKISSDASYPVGCSTLDELNAHRATDGQSESHHLSCYGVGLFADMTHIAISLSFWFLLRPFFT